MVTLSLREIIWMSNVESDSHRIWDGSQDLKNHINDVDSKAADARIFLVIDYLAALRIALDKKEFAEINDSLRRITLRWAANIHIIYIATSGNISIRCG